MFDYEVLRFVWWILIGVLLIGFAVTDGFDMGVGFLLPILGKTDTERRVMINAVAPHWDGNQVWLITAGGAMFAVFTTSLCCCILWFLCCYDFGISCIVLPSGWFRLPF